MIDKIRNLRTETLHIEPEPQSITITTHFSMDEISVTVVEELGTAITLTLNREDAIWLGEKLLKNAEEMRADA